MKYNRQLMQAIMWDRIKLAEVVSVQVISLERRKVLASLMRACRRSL
jgi:hypothetical protein